MSSEPKDTGDPATEPVVQLESIQDCSVEISDLEENLTKRKLELDPESEQDEKKIKLTTENGTEKKITKKEIQRIERQKQRELEKLEKDKKKEEERLKKEEEKRLKEQERQQKLAEKEAEREMRRKKLEEEKLERERKREEEKLAKQAEREEKERQRLEKKRKTEEEKERKEAEKRRAEEDKRRAEEAKERSQMKISSFFQRRPVSKSAKVVDQEVVSKNGSDYVSEFLPFFVQKNMVMASSGQLESTKLESARRSLDITLRESNSSSDIKSYFSSFRKSDKVIEKPITPETIVSALNSSTTTESQLYDMLTRLPPIKYISFYENSKPPYVGTWCSEIHQNIVIPVSNPIDTSLTGFDYEYDSDLEWNKEDDEGEDVDNEDDDDEDESMILEDDELSDFVEDNQEMNRGKKFHSLVVINKWNDGTNDDYFSKLTSVPLVTNLQFPIDPLQDYWNSGKAESVQSSPTKTIKATVTASVVSSIGTTETPNILTPQKKIIEDSKIVAELITFVENNNDFTLGTLVELSKKEFKQFTKALLKNTIQNIADYNKKTTNWEIRPEVKAKYIASL
ncbi:chromatin assembly complex, subunit p90 [Scheffersomyces stipitis CBS 6054]|uniref:Chromatin assembly complex, subunit p90 n=1 Tax=Scheffersomyces stipitis (strain ATCC 58785 / CBS 6054 / NBRC 10063 / NRRL Y-11545) TaxID=322104 RepID=A3GGG7_PICST|nr:chromatin assembly complex, subunit p90 [Scheffersomyces stipitis CBS 6054]EAZ63520.1 chromatin assembly complex, subunit p90 [Scheffersomyces stipitis CBS 6054]